MTTTSDTPAYRGSRLVYRPPDELRPHPTYLEICGPISESEVHQTSSQLATLVEPLLITIDGLILDGHTQWTEALQLNRSTLACIEYEFGKEEALRFILEKNRRTNRLNDFCRILLALELEPHLRDRARQRQQQGGTVKLSSTLTKADAIDVRAEIARAAGVGAGNVTKVKQLLETVTAEVRQALRRQEISIHRAWQWRRMGPEKQNQQLWQYRQRKDIRHTVRNLILRHQDEPNDVLTSEQFVGLIAESAHDALTNSSLVVANVPGHAIIVTRDLYEELLGRSSHDSHCRATA